MELGVHWSDDQLADSGVVRLMGRPTGYSGVMTSRPAVGWWGNGSADRSKHHRYRGALGELSAIETAILKWLSNAQSPNYKSEYMPNADVDTIAHLLLFQIVRVTKLSGGSIAMPCRLSRVRTTMPNPRQR